MAGEDADLIGPGLFSYRLVFANLLGSVIYSDAFFRGFQAQIFTDARRRDTGLGGLPVGFRSAIDVGDHGGESGNEVRERDGVLYRRISYNDSFFRIGARS